MSKSVGFEKELNLLSEMAPAGYALALHIRFASPSFMFRTYPADWIEVYTQQGYMLCDPIVSWGLGNEGVSRWNEIDIPDPHGVLEQAKPYGLKYGVVVSFGPLSSRSIGGFARSDRDFTDAELTDLADLAHHLHEITVPPKSLTKAQVEALQLIANGSRYAAAAVQLGISESALKLRLKSARERLLARTTAEAVQRAIEYKLI